MLSYVTVGSNDLVKAKEFFDFVLMPLNIRSQKPKPTAINYKSEDTGFSLPTLSVVTPYNQLSATAGNGTMIVLAARSRDQVFAVHAAAVERGGVSEGAPGLREQYGSDYFGAYFRDLDGNKFGVLCRS